MLAVYKNHFGQRGGVSQNRNNDQKLMRIEQIIYLAKGAFTQHAFDVCGCNRKLWCVKFKYFLYLQKCNCLLQLHAENTTCLNVPESTAFVSCKLPP